MAVTPSGISAAQYVAIVRMGEKHFAYDAAEGDDLGNYEGEFVKQRCIRVMRPDTALTVYFRPDLGAERLEVVVELGRCWIEGTRLEPAHITTPYTCEIQYKGRTVATVKVPYHWWWARWRWHSAARPVVRHAAELDAKRLVPPFDRSGLYGANGKDTAVVWSGPMDTAKVMTGMAAPGDRAEIGLFTESQAQYLISGSPEALATMLSQAEACGTMPMHWRDEHTGGIVDVYQYPTLSADSGGKPQLPEAPPPRSSGGPANGNVDVRYFLVEQAHTPPLPYLPYLLTDDPYYLEELEALATMAICRNSYHRATNKRPGVVYLGETRSFGWSMRSLFQLGVVAPQSPPAWLKSRAYWRRCIADNRAVMQLYMDSPSRLQKIFRAFPISDMISGWQNCYVGIVLVMAVWMGYDDWREQLHWFFTGITKLCDGQSGWSRQWPVPYYYHPYRAWKNAGTFGLVADTHLDANTAASFGEAWADFKVENKIDDKGWDGHTIMQAQSGPIYFLYLRGTLAFATHVGVPDAPGCLRYITAELPHAMATFRVEGNARWSFKAA